MTPVALVPLLLCWGAGVALATAGRRHAARCFAGARLPFRQVLTAQLAGTALNRLIPAGGGLVAAHLALLRRRAADGPHLGAALGGYAAGGALAHLVLTAAAAGLLVTGLVGVQVSALAVPALPWRWLGVVVVVVGLAVVVALRRNRGWVSRAAASVRAAGALVRARPGAVLRVGVFQAGTSVLAGAALWSALWATGTALPVLTVLVVYVLSSTLAAALPAPGGTGPLEAGLVGGLALVGVALVPATAAVVLFRLVTHWLPVPLGLLAGAAVLRSRCRPVASAQPVMVTA